MKRGVILAMWNDNGPVTVGSNFKVTEPLDIARKWSMEDKDNIGVPRPALTGFCNKSMGWNWSNGSSNFYLPTISQR